MKADVKKNQRKLLKAVADAGDDGILLGGAERREAAARCAPCPKLEVQQALYAPLVNHGLAEQVAVRTAERDSLRVYVTKAGRKAADLL